MTIKEVAIGVIASVAVITAAAAAKPVCAAIWGIRNADQTAAADSVDTAAMDDSPSVDAGQTNIHNTPTVAESSPTERTAAVTQTPAATQTAVATDTPTPTPTHGTESYLSGTISITADNVSEYGQLIGKLQIYGYNPHSAAQTGKSAADGITASGEKAVPGETCAMSRDVPFGTMVYVEGLGVYRVNDRGVGRGIVDIAAATDAECYQITRKANVWLLDS